jgi:phenylacetate-CoA ligase
MTAHLEVRGDTSAAVRERLEGLLKTRLGVEIAVALEAPGALAALTQVESRQKPIRLVDERK